MKTLIKFSLLLILSFPLYAQDFDREKMDSFFSLIDQHDKGMGSLSIFKNGKEIYSKTIGFANVATNKKADAHTRYRVGSITKTFTASIIMQLIEEGDLQLETKLSQFFPNIPNSAKINIENMLRHQSGLYNFSEAADFSTWKNQPQSREDHLARMLGKTPVFEPGEKTEYSNTNYVLLSFIIEDLEKKKLSQVIAERILKPLRLTRTACGGILDPAKGEALAYEKTGKWTVAEETHMSVVKGAGGLSSTPADLNYFVTALFSGKVVQPESLSKMLEMENELGLGLMEIPVAGMSFYGHTGGIDGFNAVVIYDPREQVGIAYISNAREMAPSKILDAVVHIYYGKSYELPSFQSLTLTPEQLKKFEGTYGAADFPLELKIYQEGGRLMGQAKGQPSFPLEAYEPNKFKFDRFGLKLEFLPKEGKLHFKQGPNSHELKKA